ncbi:hypothetical protein JXA85_08740 [Candidatus Woesearchaeota archaeon]|nr:hypothetical protein [Candidatus Woesearchaeota archaeon]
MKKSQTWSTDVMIATVLFVIIFIGLVYIVSMNASSRVVNELKDESKIIPAKIVYSPTTAGNLSTSFIVNNKVDKERLRAVSELSYAQMKSVLGVKHDFCIYLEDEYGNMINISDVTADKSPCIGSPNATLNGAPCG